MTEEKTRVGVSDKAMVSYKEIKYASYSGRAMVTSVINTSGGPHTGYVMTERTTPSITAR